MTEFSTYNDLDFSQQYFLLRKKEGRIYSDEEVARLPQTDIEHRHYHEWQARKESCARLIKYLTDKKRSLEILEIGCGNGWLAAKLSTIPSSSVTAIDINTEELKQARRIFSRIPNLEFFECSINKGLLQQRQFDVIVFAASIQYFSSVTDTLKDSLEKLNQDGEIHIIDSPFYNEDEVGAAKKRSDDYYKAIGCPQLSGKYFHHTINDLGSFDHEVLYDPNSILNKLKRNRNPFYWFRIKAND